MKRCQVLGAASDNEDNAAAANALSGWAVSQSRRNRPHGETGDVELRFNKRTYRFESVDRG